MHRNLTPLLLTLTFPSGQFPFSSFLTSWLFFSSPSHFSLSFTFLPAFLLFYSFSPLLFLSPSSFLIFLATLLHLLIFTFPNSDVFIGQAANVYHILMMLIPFRSAYSFASSSVINALKSLLIFTLLWPTNGNKAGKNGHDIQSNAPPPSFANNSTTHPKLVVV